MNKNSGKQKAESQPEGGRRKADGGRIALVLPPPSTLPLRPSRPGLTLIELLVTIVIMVTVLAGVLPLVSPNNNARKLREASRQLNSLLSQAQAQAARDGRPVGVAFRESGAPGPLSGMALEAYVIAEPPPFAGFSEWSRVSVNQPPDDKLTYGDPSDASNANGNDGKMFDPRYRGYKIWQLIFWLYGVEDQVPPRMVRNGDTINVDGNYFLVVDDPGGSEGAHQIDPDTGYVTPTSRMFAIWLNNHGQQLSPGMKSYSFRRQPVNTSDQPLQFPRGIGIDLQASGADGLDVPFSFDNGGPTTIGLMFSPNGSINALYRNGIKMDGVEQAYFLMGLFENGNDANNGQDENDYDFTAGMSITDEELAQRRTRINWLNPDSRWVSVNRAGRIITADNNISFDPRMAAYSNSISGTPQEQNLERMMRQLNGADSDGDGIIDLPGARLYAKQMSGSTGR